MNYKVNNLSTTVVCEEVLIQDFPTLMFGVTPDKVTVFDATAYCQQEGLHEPSAAGFGMACRILIDNMMRNKNLQPTNLFYISADKHTLMHRALAYLFLMLANPNVMDYFFGLIDEILGRGFALSDSFLASLADERIPSDYLRAIIENRKEGENEG